MQFSVENGKESFYFILFYFIYLYIYFYGGAVTEARPPAGRLHRADIDLPQKSCTCTVHPSRFNPSEPIQTNAYRLLF